MTTDIDAINHPARDTLADWQIADLGQAILTLTRELWVVKDRVRVLEAVLDERGIEVHDAVDRYQPDDSLTAELANEGEALAGRIVAALAGKAGTGSADRG